MVSPSQPTTDELLNLVEWARATESLFPAHALKYARIAELLGNHAALAKALEAALLIAKQEWDFPGAHPHRAAVVHQMEAALSYRSAKT